MIAIKQYADNNIFMSADLSSLGPENAAFLNRLERKLTFFSGVQYLGRSTFNALAMLGGYYVLVPPEIKNAPDKTQE